MLTPCSPCLCPKSPCEHCMFGYNSSYTNHKQMKELIEAVDRGEKPLGYVLADNYKRMHPNWKEQMEEELE